MKAMILVAVGALGACAAQPLDDIHIACTADSECPDGAWCDLRYHDNVCRSLEHSAPPHIVYEGFVVGDKLVPTIAVPSKTVTIHTFRLRNDGGSQTYVTVDVGGPPCLDAGSLVRSDGELVDAGKELDADFSVDPAVGCTSPATLAITATASDRVFMFTAMVSITP
jgi:hypothetical protein